jgi:hypothetical protein
MKKLMTVLAVGALMLSMAGIAVAADVDINIYGSSAQYKFWTVEAVPFLQAQGCTIAAANTLSVDTTTSTCPNGANACTANGGWPAGVNWHGVKYFIASATACPAAVSTNGNVNIRVAAYDSNDGIQAALGHTNPLDVGECVGNQRTQLATVAGGNNVNNFDCYPTTLGASDVNGTSLVQNTTGWFDGPAGPASPNKADSVCLISNGATCGTGAGTAGPQINIDLGHFVANNTAGASYRLVPTQTCGAGSGLTDYHPLVVPWGFFANKDAQTTGDGLLQPHFTNLTPAMIALILSGNVFDWHQFYPAIPANSFINLCLRVGGSGTMATFDVGVVRTNGTGPTIPTEDSNLLNNGIWFNNTSGDLANCINNFPGSFGPLDADNTNKGDTYGAIPFNGALPTAANIQNGLYDRFWSLEHIFAPNPFPGAPSQQSALVTALAAFAAVQANIPAAEVPFWMTSANMNVQKATDFAYPPVWNGAGYNANNCYE